jgi:hypothetical protein
MQSSDPRNLFQTDSSIARSEERQQKSERSKTAGQPFKLPSKPLTLVVRGDDAWTAESGGVIRRISLEVRMAFRA